MRLRLLLSAITIFFVLSIAFIPNIILSAVTKVEITPVSERMYQSLVHCNGEIIQKQVKEIYLDTPVIAEQIPVQVGDRVRRGQVLATINIQQTQSVLAQGQMVSQDDAVEKERISPAEIEAFASRYGLSTKEISSILQQYEIEQSASREGEQRGFIPTEIIAPIDGIVTEINLQADVLTSSNKPAIIVSDDNSYAVKASVSESDISKIQEGDRALITGVGFDGREYAGSITRIYPVARKSGTLTEQQTVVDVEIALDGGDERLKPGLSAKVVVTTQDSGRITAIPYEAVRQDQNNQEYVYVYRDNHVQRRDITTGIEMTYAIQVTSGLALGELVVVNPDEVKDTERLAYAVEAEI